MSSLTIRPVAGHIGADIDGADLSQPLPDGTIEEIRQALHRHKVVFFRGQTLDHTSQIAFARRFGELTYAHPHDDAPPEDHPEIFTVDPDRLEKRFGKGFRDEYRWHTDVTPAVNPPAGSILRAEVVPDFGGDTQWTNLVAAYQGLSAPVRAFVDTLRAEHRYGGSYGVKGDNDFARSVNKNLLVAVHPVVRVHPETGNARSSSTRASPATSSTPARARASTSSTCSSPRSPDPSTRCGSAGRPGTSPSGTTGSPHTSRRATWNTSSWSGGCTESPCSATSR